MDVLRDARLHPVQVVDHGGNGPSVVPRRQGIEDLFVFVRSAAGFARRLEKSYKHLRPRDQPAQNCGQFVVA